MASSISHESLPLTRWGSLSTYEIINEGKGEHFDPVVIDAFNRIIRPVYDEIYESDEKYLRDTVRKIINRYF
jgi:hypothetical protein